MNRFNFKFFSRFWEIAKLYWLGNEKKGALTLLGILFVLLIAYTQLSVILTQKQGEIISSLSAKNVDRFWNTIKIFLFVLILYVPLFAGFNYLQEKVGIYWRKWLTYHFLNRYFSDRSFYELGNFNRDVDNPDQRIAEDIRGFTQDSLLFLLVIANSIFQIIAFSVVLWNISSILVLILIVYGIGGTAITIGLFGKKLVRINFEQLRKEANFRYGLVRIRENSESIAFYRGETQENNQLKNIFIEVFRNYNLLIVWRELYLGLFTNAYEFFPYIIPAIVVAPSVFSGEFEVGKVTEAQIAFARVFSALNLIVARFQSLTAFAAGVDRLSELKEYLDRSQQTKTAVVLPDRPTIKTIIEERLAAEDLTLQTPNYHKTLVENLNVNLATGQGLLIMGASGCGKSSLLRAIAGLWNSGNGKIYRPVLEKMLFLPQKPYMILGTLRNQLTYPNPSLKLTDEEIAKILTEVNLADIAERFGGLDLERDWAEVLSLGEQQRLAFARILVNKPQYVILDEATSALDVNNEAGLYSRLQQSQTTFVSVGHRPTLVKYHHLVLEMYEGNRWQLKESSQFAAETGDFQ